MADPETLQGLGALQEARPRVNSPDTSPPQDL